jgi:hypothetical protein
MLFPLILATGLARAVGTYPKDTGPFDSGYLDTGNNDDSGDDDSGDDGSGYIPLPNNDYDGHLDGQLAYQMADDKGGCATVGGPADLALALALVGAVAGRLRRPRR